MGAGSCSTMPYWRIPNGEKCGGKWTGKRAHCVSCNHKLRTRDMLPVINWLLTMGKCHFCGAKINPIYFLIEFSITLFSALLYLKLGFDQLYIIIMGLVCSLTIATAMDYTYGKIYDRVLVVVLSLGAVYRSLIDGQIYDFMYLFANVVIFGVAFAAIYKKIKGKDMKDYKYLKLIACVAVWLNYTSFAYFALYSLPLFIIGYFMFRKALALTISVPFLLLVIYPEILAPASLIGNF